MTPRLTVLMTVYNGERYLREAMDSILGQTFQDFEFLIVNDGSTDATPMIIASYDDPRIRVVQNERNLGQTRSLNRGLELARGDYVARQDADDISEPERLAMQVEFLDRHPAVAAVGAQGNTINADGEYVGPYAVPTPARSLDIHWKLLFLNPLIHGVVMMRREVVLSDMGGYDTRFSYAADYDLWSRISFRCCIANLPDPLIRYRVHEQQMWESHSNQRWSEPAEIRVRNIRRIAPELRDDQIEVLNVMGRGTKRLPTAFSVEHSCELYFRFRGQFLSWLPSSTGSCREIAAWQREQNVQSFLFLADACVQQSLPRQAFLVLWKCARLDPRAVRRFGPSLAKILLGRRLTNSLARRRRSIEAYRIPSDKAVS